jgi:hypothetical protein
MRRIATLAAAVLAAAAVAAAPAAAKEDSNAPVLVQLNSPPPAGAVWDARFSLIQGPGGYDPPDGLRPVVVVTNVRTQATRRFATHVDIPPNAFRADVRLPGPGTWRVAITGFDPRRPESTRTLAPVRIAPPSAAARGGDTTLWPWALLAPAGLAAAAILLLRRRAQVAGTAPPATGAPDSA